ncbi:hypothetical protein EDD21DRAFT_376214 [Dissophora ornata]|nr:hypothetical protein EDD21DRAFT_376214 [Dissophora ornata]
MDGMGGFLLLVVAVLCGGVTYGVYCCIKKCNRHGLLFDPQGPTTLPTVAPGATEIAMDQSGHIAPVKLLSARVSNQIRQQQQQREAHDPSMVTATTVTTPASAAANSDSADSYELDTVTIVPLPRYERLPQASAQYTAGPEAESPRPPAYSL